MCVCVFDTDKLRNEINKVVNKYFDQGVAELVEMRMAESVDVMIWCECVCLTQTNYVGRSTRW